MSTLKGVIIIDETTLELTSDAHKGDRINLKEIMEVDASIIRNKIDEQRDKIYEEKLNQFKEVHKKEIEAALASKEVEFSKTINKFENENEVLKSRILQLEKDKENEIKVALNSQKTELSADYLVLKTQYETQKERYDNELEKVKLKYEKDINDKQREIDRLALNYKVLNTKQLGEKLENWANLQMEERLQNSFEECTWKKDNENVKGENEAKGTKADFIFKIYKDKNHKEEELLSSVVLEMKNEFLDSENKKKNSDHYEKLDKDRKKKNCEYALLVSELEWNIENDLPFFKVYNYEKMYVVRPQYFVQFLTIIESFALKEQELKAQLNREKIQFKNIDEILDDFNSFKESLLNNQIHNIESNISTIKEESSKIRKSADSIDKACDTIISTHINQIKNKVSDFNIEKLTKKIEKAE